MKRFGLAAIILACTFTAAAYDADGISYSTYAGQNTCGTFLNDVEKSEAVKSQYLAYIEGYVTAINMRVSGRRDFFAATDAEARYRFVYEHCRKNPLDHVTRALYLLTVAAGVPPRSNK
jgi:hypothetical protein